MPLIRRLPLPTTFLQRRWRALPEPVRDQLEPAKQRYLNLAGRARIDMAERWDREWIHYFRRAPEYFNDVSEPNDDSRRRVARVGEAIGQRFDGERGPVDEANPVWDIWAIGCYPDEISRRAVADLGCGAGGIGRTLGYVADTYLGTDFSPLALRVATLVSPPSCRYVLRSDRRQLRKAAGTIDTAFSRNMFIHQNFDQAVELVTVGAGLLKPGGLLVADFRRPDTERFVNPHPARGPLDVKQPSRGYYFTDDDIADVAAAAGLRLERTIEVPERGWRLARMRSAA